jgi:hypothetical protein
MDRDYAVKVSITGRQLPVIADFSEGGKQHSANDLSELLNHKPAQPGT